MTNNDKVTKHTSAVDSLCLFIVVCPYSFFEFTRRKHKFSKSFVHFVILSSIGDYSSYILFRSSSLSIYDDNDDEDGNDDHDDDKNDDVDDSNDDEVDVLSLL